MSICVRSTAELGRSAEEWQAGQCDLLDVSMIGAAAPPNPSVRQKEIIF